MSKRCTTCAERQLNSRKHDRLAAREGSQVAHPPVSSAIPNIPAQTGTSARSRLQSGVNNDARQARGPILRAQSERNAGKRPVWPCCEGRCKGASRVSLPNGRGDARDPTDMPGPTLARACFRNDSRDQNRPRRAGRRLPREESPRRISANRSDIREEGTHPQGPVELRGLLAFLLDESTLASPHGAALGDCASAIPMN